MNVIGALKEESLLVLKPFGFNLRCQQRLTTINLQNIMMLQIESANGTYQSVFRTVSNTSDGGFFPKQSVNYFHKKMHQRCLIESYTAQCSPSEFFWSLFSHIWTEYGKVLRISPQSVRMRENMERKNSEYGHFLRSPENTSAQVL